MAEEHESTEFEGITDDTPDEITSFIRENDVAEKYTVMLKEHLEEGGKPVYIRSYTNKCPSINEIGKQWGPGSYKLVFSWRGENKAGKMEQMTRDMPLDLAERSYRDVYEEYREELRRKRLETKEKVWIEDAAKMRAQGGNLNQQPPAPVSELDTMKKALEMARGLGIPIGGAQKAAAPEPHKSFSQTMLELTPALVALGGIMSPIIVAMLQRPKEKSDTTIMNTLLAHALEKPKEDSVMKETIPFLLGTMQKIFEVKASMEPEPQESLVERIIGKLAPMVPAVLAMAAGGQQAVNASPIVGMVRKSEDMQALAKDAEAQIMAVQRLDEQYGFQQTNKILMVAGLPRPEELAENFRQYPSPGFRPDGISEKDYLDAARNAKQPDIGGEDESENDG